MYYFIIIAGIILIYAIGYLYSVYAEKKNNKNKNNN